MKSIIIKQKNRLINYINSFRLKTRGKYLLLGCSGGKQFQKSFPDHSNLIFFFKEGGEKC